MDEDGEIEGVPKGLTEILVDSWEKYCSNEPVFLQGRFNAFMQEICNSYYTHLSNEVFSRNVSIRPHFRLCCKKNDSYRCNAFSSSQIQKSDPPKGIQYGGLIEQAYKLRKPLIYSAKPI